MITSEKARRLLHTDGLAAYTDTELEQLAHDLAQTVIDLHAGRISCYRCSAPMIAQEPDNTPGNDSLEVCSRCTRALYTEDLG